MGSISLSATFANAGTLGALGGVIHSPIPSAELAAIRAIAASALSLQCVIQRRTTTTDATLHHAVTYSIVNVVNAGMAQPTAGQLQNYDYLIGDLATWQIRLPYGTDVREQDHLLISGQTLVVQVLLDPRAFASTTLLLASEVK